MIDVLEKTETEPVTDPRLAAIPSGPPTCYVCSKPAAPLTWCKQCKQRLCGDHAYMFPDGARCPEHKGGM